MAPQRFTVWDLVHDRRRFSLDLATPESAGPVISVALGPGDRTLYAVRIHALDQAREEVWDTASGRRTADFAGPTRLHLAVHLDGRLLVGDNGAARLLSDGGSSDRATSRVCKVKGLGLGLVQGDQIGALAFAAYGSRLAAGDQTGRVALWDGTLRRREDVLRNVFPQLLDEIPEAVSVVAFSPDGRALAVGGDQGTLQLWDIPTRQPLGGPLITPGERIDTLAFGADSGTLYAGSAHVPLQRCTVAPARVVPQVCARAGTDLTAAQWRTYIPDVPYRRVCGDAGAGSR
ncbi:hypothetical protein [Streptomyces sp. NPDC000618]|uniref:WD40 repeat domain-containing protein n=1 Tax=Streptomyces sp. NPDC000618 TaxID=3154265 RepID=UPI00332BB568